MNFSSRYSMKNISLAISVKILSFSLGALSLQRFFKDLDMKRKQLNSFLLINNNFLYCFQKMSNVVFRCTLDCTLTLSIRVGAQSIFKWLYMLSSPCVSLFFIQVLLIALFITKLVFSSCTNNCIPLPESFKYQLFIWSTVIRKFQWIFNFYHFVQRWRGCWNQEGFSCLSNTWLPKVLSWI